MAVIPNNRKIRKEQLKGVVETVTGTGVDNTDPKNPVVTGSGGASVKCYNTYANAAATSLTVTSATYTSFSFTPTFGSLDFTPSEMSEGAVYKVEFELICSAEVSTLSSPILYRFGINGVYPPNNLDFASIAGAKARATVYVTFYGATAASRSVNLTNVEIKDNQWDLTTTVDSTSNKTFNIQMRNIGGSGVSATVVISYLKIDRII